MKQNTQYCPYCMTPVPEGETCPVCGLTSGTYTPQPHHLRPGTVLLERYLVGRVLGEGGFGITYIGCDLRLELKVAIKEYYPVDKAVRNAAISPELVSYSIGSSKDGFERGKRKFLNEARTMAKMDKQQVIVSAKDFFETNNTAYIVMEYIEGTTFTELVAQKGGRIPPAELLPMIEPLFKALSVVHKNGLIHRDISPDNLMLEDGEVRLIDFGCAREAERGNETLTITLKHGYAPIEQYQQHGQGPWTDVYALCATIYYCLVGQKPPQALDRIGGDNGLLLPSKLGVPLTRGQEEALLKGLNLSPKGRFQSMEELHGALYPAVPEEPPGPRPGPDPVDPDPIDPDPEPKPGKPRRYLSWAAALAAALALAVLVWALLPKTEGDVEPAATVAAADARFENAYVLTQPHYSEEELRLVLEDPSVESLILPAGGSTWIDYLESGQALTLTKPLRIEEGALFSGYALCIDGEGYLEVNGELNMANLWLKGEVQRISFPAGTGEDVLSTPQSLWMESEQNLAASDFRYFTEHDTYAFICKADPGEAKEAATLQELKSAADENPAQGIRITQDILMDQSLTFECPVYICQGVTVSADNQEVSILLNNGGILINYGTFQGGLWAGENATVVNYGTLGLTSDRDGVSLWFSEEGRNLFLNFGAMAADNVSRLWPGNTMVNTGSGVVEAVNFYLLGCHMSNNGQIHVLGDFEGFYIGKGGELANGSRGTITVHENGNLVNLGLIYSDGTVEVTDGGGYTNTLFMNNSGVLRISEGAQLNPDRPSWPSVFYDRSGETDPSASAAYLFYGIPQDGSLRGGQAASTEEALRALLEDASVESIVISEDLRCHGDLTVCKPLYLTGSLTVESGALTAQGAALILENGGSLEADGISLLAGSTVAMLSDSRMTVSSGGSLQLDQSLIWGWWGAYLKAENADVKLQNGAAIAVEWSASGNFLQMDHSTIEVTGGSFLMPAYHDEAALCGVTLTVQAGTLFTGQALELKDSTVILKRDGLLLNSSNYLTLENCTLDIRKGGHLQSEYSDLNLVNSTVKNAGNFSTGGWMEHRLTIIDGSFVNSGDCHLYSEVELLEDASIANYGRLYYNPDAHALDLSRIAIYEPIAEG